MPGFVQAEAPGYITVRWAPPSVSIPGTENYTLNGHYYILNLTHDEGGGLGMELHNTSDTSYVVASPLWGSGYTISLMCWHHHLPVPCGSSVLTAVPQISASCRAHSSFCQEEERIRFMSPAYLTSSFLANQSVLIKWRQGSRGWRTPTRILKILDRTGDSVYEKEYGVNEHEVAVTGLQPRAVYSLVFCPGGGSNIPQEIGSVRMELVVLKSEVGGLASFVSEVGLDASVDWRGRILVNWRSGRAGREGLPSTRVDSYTVTLRIGEGNFYLCNHNPSEG